MGCGCGGSGSRNTANGIPYPAATSGFRADPQEWVVTYPDGRIVTFDHDGDAYREARLHGGGIQQRAKRP